MELQVYLARFLITFVLAFIFGIYRQRQHKPIGFGTYIFVSVGACGLATTATIIEPSNPIPLLGSIVTGIGFLGAGALIKTSDKIFGFTTAASIWIFAIFGLIMGVGEYAAAIAIYILVWIVYLVDTFFEMRGMGSYQKRIFIHTNKIVNENEIEAVLLTCTNKYKSFGFEVDKKNNKISVTYLIEGSKDSLNNLPKRLYEKAWFESFKVE